jgi:hypothetical protein
LVSKRKSLSGKAVNAAGIVLKTVRVEVTPSVHLLLRIEADKRNTHIPGLVHALIRDFLAEREMIESGHAMAMVSQVWEAVKRQPFRPFSVKLADGTTYRINDPDTIRVTPSGREQFSVADAEGIHQLAAATVVEVETSSPKSPPSEAVSSED